MGVQAISSVLTEYNGDGFMKNIDQRLLQKISYEFYLRGGHILFALTSNSTSISPRCLLINKGPNAPIARYSNSHHTRSQVANHLAQPYAWTNALHCSFFPQTISQQSSLYHHMSHDIPHYYCNYWSFTGQEINILLFFAPLTFVEYIFILLVYVNTIYVSTAFELILHKCVIKRNPQKTRKTRF